MGEISLVPNTHMEQNLFHRKQKQPFLLLNFQFTDYFKGS